MGAKSSVESSAHCQYLVANYCYSGEFLGHSHICWHVFHRIAELRVLQDTLWVMLTLSTFLNLQKEKLRPRESCSLDSFILENVHGSASSYTTHFHSHQKQQKDTGLGWNYVLL